MKRLAIAIFILLTAVSVVCAEDTAKSIQTKIGETVAPLEKTMGAITDAITKYTVTNALQRNVWADAYIGQLISIPPHLGVGATLGGTIMPIDLSDINLSAVTGMLGNLSIGSVNPADLLNKMVEKAGILLPGAALNARIGGIVLPFDLGVSVLFLGNREPDVTETFSYGYTTYSADLRYAIMKQGVVKPNISVGLGYTKSMGHLVFSPNVNISSVTVNGKMRMEFDTNIYTLSAQVSKKILIVTPYGGARVSLQNGFYRWYDNLNATATISGNTETVNYENGNENKVELGFNDMDIQLFAGVGLKLLVFDISLGACYDISNTAWAGNINLRVKL